MTSMMSVVTGLPPRIDGIGDYALSLARRIRRDVGVETRFIVGDPAWNGPARVEGFEVDRLAERSRAGLLRLLRGEAEEKRMVFLHYGGYGYAARGCPSWLIDGLQ
ncbi:MAG TPA: glycosyltransferase family 1 protein, partial [Blastocatellia bacterium]